MGIPLTKVSRLPDVAFSRWRLADGTLEEHPLGLDAYRSMALPGNAAVGALKGTRFLENKQDDGTTLLTVVVENPTKDPAAVFVNARAGSAFNTPSGDLEPGNVVDWRGEPDAFDLLIKLSGPRDVMRITLDEFSKGGLDDLSALTLKADQQSPTTTVRIVDGQLEETARGRLV